MIVSMVRVAQLGLLPRDLLQAVPPHLDKVKENPATCKHEKCKRFGNLHGRYATCLTCGTRLEQRDRHALRPCSLCHCLCRGQSRALRRRSHEQPTRRDLWSQEPGTRLGLWAPDLRPPHGRAVPGSIQHRQPRASVLPHSEELCRARLLQRGDLQGAKESDAEAGRSSSLGASHRDGRGELSGRRDLRLAVSGNFVKSGTAKRMRGQWMKSARLLESEHQTYVTRKTTRDRPPPAVDLWELFAGRALCSELAHQYDLEALQPWDLVYGQDFMFVQCFCWS